MYKIFLMAFFLQTLITEFKFPETWFSSGLLFHDFFSWKFIGSPHAILGKKRPRNLKHRTLIPMTFFPRDFRKFELFSRVFISRFVFPGTFFPGLPYIDSYKIWPGLEKLFVLILKLAGIFVQNLVWRKLKILMLEHFLSLQAFTFFTFPVLKLSIGLFAIKKFQNYIYL